MNNTRYTNDHEWIKLNEDNTVVIGITDHAQKELGDIVFIEMPEVNTSYARGDELIVIESVKAASGIKAPVTGKVLEINESLVDAPELINQDPQGDAWILIIKLSDTSELNELMFEDKYQEYLSGE